MRITQLYYMFGGRKDSFFYRKWQTYKMNRSIKSKRKLLQCLGNEALNAMSAACKEADVFYWLEFGTLLGAYREHGFITHDDDMDISMWAEDCTRDFENVLLKYGFQKKRAFYLYNEDTKTQLLTEIALSYKGLQLDIFFNFRKNDSKRVCYVYCEPENGEKLIVKEFVLPSFEETEMLEINQNFYMAPACPSNILKILYGEDYMTPKRNANATKSINSHINIFDINKLYGIRYMIG